MPKIPACAIELIKRFEGFRANAYPDPLSGGKPITIGYGCTRKFNGSEWEIGDRISEPTAFELLIHQLENEYLPDLERIPCWSQLNDNQKGALISFAYNMKVGGRFYGHEDFETITRVLKNQSWGEIEKALTLYCNPGTNVEDGLRRRRRAEVELFTRPLLTMNTTTTQENLELNIILNTWLKQIEGSAAELSDAQKIAVRPGQKFKIASALSDKNHWRVTLITPILAQDGSGPYNEWRVFKEHCVIQPSTASSTEVSSSDQLGVENSPQKYVASTNVTDLTNQDVQQILINLGLLDPPADGKWGRQSKASLEDFQRYMKLPPTGELTPETKAALIDAKPFIKLDNSYPSRVVRFMQSQGYFVAAGNRRFNIVMIEGINPDTGELTPDRPNEFCDARILLEIPFSGIPRIIGAWEATCKAGYHYVDYPMNPKGTARCARSQFKAWQIGYHGIHNPHEALLQVFPVRVHRYHGRKNYYKEINGKIDEGVFQINFHWGYNYPKTDIEYASAGCLVGRTTEGHKNCMRFLKNDRRFEVNNQYIFYITIISGKDIQLNSPLYSQN
jgi:GH24 family phage-related lysozyme (muramidase)